MSVKIKVLDAVIDGHGSGAVISVTEQDAAHLVGIGYAERVDEQQPAKPKAAPKAKAKTADTPDK